jgi:hypothetical protein
MMERAAVHPGLRVPAVVAWPLLVAGLAAAIWSAYELGRRTGGSRFISAGPRIEEVREIAKLAVLRVQVADVIEGDTAGARAAVLVKGDADMTVDLERIEIADRDDDRRTATLLIPTPQPERPRLDHDRTRIYELEETGLALLNPFADPRADLLADCMRAAQEDVERAVRDAEFVVQAKAQTEQLLRSFYRQWGWEVTIEWQPAP